MALRLTHSLCFFVLCHHVYLNRATGSPIPILERLPVDESVAGLSMQRRLPLIINEPNTQLQTYHLNTDLRSMLVAPLCIKGESIGVLDIVNKSGEFTKDDLRVMSIFADQAAITIENARLYQQVVIDL